MDYSMSYGGARQTTPGRSSRQTTPALSGGSLTPNAYNPSVPSIHRVAPSGTHTHTIILLHGRNSSGDEFESELFMGLSSQKLTLEEHFPSWKWVFPSSPERFSTAFQEHLEQWFDIYSLTDPSKDEELQKEGLQASCDFIRGVVEAECREVPPERIVLGGISMGAATAIHALLLGGRRLGGLVGFCGWCPFRRQLESVQTHRQEGQQTRETVMDYLKEFYKAELGLEVGPGTIPPEARYGSLSPPSSVASTGAAGPAGASKKYAIESLRGMDIALDTPVFLSHSVEDEVVDIEHGRALRDTAEVLGMEVTWREYASVHDQYDDDSDEEEHGEHWIQEPHGFDDLVDFLERVEREAYAGRGVPPTPTPSTPKQAFHPASSQPPPTSSQQPTPMTGGRASGPHLANAPLSPTSPPHGGLVRAGTESKDQNLLNMYLGGNANLNLGTISSTTSTTRSGPGAGMVLPQNHGHASQGSHVHVHRPLGGILEYGEPIDSDNAVSGGLGELQPPSRRQRQESLSRPRDLSFLGSGGGGISGRSHQHMSIENGGGGGNHLATVRNSFLTAVTARTATATTAPDDGHGDVRKDVRGIASSSPSSSYR